MLVYVRYEDHVLFNRAPPLTTKPQTRETVGWLNYDCDDYLVVSWDRDCDPPTLKGKNDQKATGLVVLKSAILELKKLEARTSPLTERSEWPLSSETIIVKPEYALPAEKRKTQRKKKGMTAT